MQIHGFNKTTLLDYPGIVAATIFTGGCNFRCPFCQNADLVLDPNSQPIIPEEEVLNHLGKRKGITKGVCITGGEPTLQKDLVEFIKRIKEMDLLVKIDSNGYRPDILKELIDRKLIDYIAMDIKSSPTRYHEAAGTAIEIEKIKESVNLIMRSGLSYEFRTTVVKELHDIETMAEIADFISGADKYFLQGYEDSDRVIARGFSAYTRQELEGFKTVLKGKIKEVTIRGVE